MAVAMESENIHGASVSGGADSGEGSSRKAMGVPAPHVTSFCCCLGLEVGAKFVGYLHLLASTCLLALCSLYAHKFGQLAGTAEDAGDGVYEKWYRATIAVSVVSVGHVVLAITLLYGAYKRNSVALRVWVYVLSVLVVVSIALNVGGSLGWGVEGTGSDIFLSLLEGLLFYAFVLYCILVVHSYSLLVRSCQDMQGPTTNY